MKKTIVAIAALFVFFNALFLSFSGLRSARAETSPGSSPTLENLLKAYQGESNAHARYTAFAAKAEEEGFSKVAGLFRAAAVAEKIHADNLASVIEKMGGTAQARIEPPTVETTKENLEAALEGETHERDRMYPEFLEQARKEGRIEAAKVFNFAMAAEAEHARLYDALLKNPESWKDPAKPIYVCPVCGYTVENLPDRKCPICFTPREKFLAIS